MYRVCAVVSAHVSDRHRLSHLNGHAGTPSSSFEGRGAARYIFDNLQSSYRAFSNPCMSVSVLCACMCAFAWTSSECVLVLPSHSAVFLKWYSTKREVLLKI